MNIYVQVHVDGIVIILCQRSTWVSNLLFFWEKNFTNKNENAKSLLVWAYIYMPC